MNHMCRKCLLLEAGERKSYNTISDFLETVDDKLKVCDKIFFQRIEKCRECDNLISGMCLKCGCYVELRARLKNKSCADYDNIKW